MNEYMVWLVIGIVICLLVFIGVPLLGKIIREKDFNIYHVSPAQTQNPDEYVTEACFPVV